MKPNPYPSSLLVPRARAVRRRQARAVRQAKVRTQQERTRRLDNRGRISTFLLPGPTQTTITNPRRDTKSLQSGRLRKELHP